MNCPAKTFLLIVLDCSTEIASPGEDPPGIWNICTYFDYRLTISKQFPNKYRQSKAKLLIIFARYQNHHQWNPTTWGNKQVHQVASHHSWWFPCNPSIKSCNDAGKNTKYTRRLWVAKKNLLDSSNSIWIFNPLFIPFQLPSLEILGSPITP